MKLLKKIAEIIFPNQCLSCKILIGQEGLFCSQCWQKLQFITEPKCKICSQPFDYKIDDNLSCPRCLSFKPYFDKTIVALRYNLVIRKIIKNFKYYDNSYLAKKLAPLLFSKIALETNNFDIIAAVPLHKKRLRIRKFNQSILLAKEISNKFKKPLYYNLIFRIKNTANQASLKRKERERNLKNAFLFNDAYIDLIKNKKILLVDDVMTTGATLDNCAKVLKKAGAKEVIVAVVAKRVFGQVNF
ncbi:MAG: ComF family protein [Pelagibacterales bacterium]|nr:ComF family protein [Pelagibacterales bacterium]